MVWKKFSRRIFAQIVIDTALILLATLLAFVVKHDAGDPTTILRRDTIMHTLPILLVFRLVSLYAFRLYRIHWRYLSMHDLRQLVVATTASSVAFYLFLAARGLGAQSDYSWGMQLTDWGICIFLLGGVRAFYRELPDTSLLKGKGESVT